MNEERKRKKEKKGKKEKKRKKEKKKKKTIPANFQGQAVILTKW